MLFEHKRGAALVLAALAWGWAGAGYAVAVEAQSNSGPLDTAPPVIGAVVAPPVTSSFPLSVQFSGVTDSGSGAVARVELWSRTGSEVWSSTGLSDTSGQAAGSWNFQPSSVPLSSTTLHFSVVAEDSFGNSTPRPSGNTAPGAATTAFQPVSTVTDWMLY